MGYHNDLGSKLPLIDSGQKVLKAHAECIQSFMQSYLHREDTGLKKYSKSFVTFSKPNSYNFLGRTQQQHSNNKKRNEFLLIFLLSVQFHP